MLHHIKMSLEEKAKISFAEVFWALSDIGIGTIPELCEELSLAAPVVQQSLDVLKGLGIVRGYSSSMHYMPNSLISECHLMWLRRYESPARHATRQRHESLAKAQELKVVTTQDGLTIRLRSNPGKLIGRSGWKSFFAGYSMINFMNSSYRSTSQRKITILFSSKEAAQEVAWSLRADWDGLTGVTLPQTDRAAIETTARSVGSEYCRVGDHCYSGSSDAKTSSTFTELLSFLSFLT